MSDAIRRLLENTMTVGQVKRMLGNDDNRPVIFTADYGDRGHTEQALPVNEIIDAESTDLRETPYSHSDVAIVDNEYDESPRTDVPDVEPIIIAVIRS